MAQSCILKQIKSPLLDVARIMVEEATKVTRGKKGGPTPESQLEIAKARIVAEVDANQAALVETVFTFTRPASELRELLAEGREAFTAAAFAEVGDKTTPVQFDDLQKLVAAHYFDSFAQAQAIPSGAIALAKGMI